MFEFSIDKLWCLAICRKYSCSKLVKPILANICFDTIFVVGIVIDFCIELIRPIVVHVSYSLTFVSIFYEAISGTAKGFICKKSIVLPHSYLRLERLDRPIYLFTVNDAHKVLLWRHIFEVAQDIASSRKIYIFCYKSAIDLVQLKVPISSTVGVINEIVENL